MVKKWPSRPMSAQQWAHCRTASRARASPLPACARVRPPCVRAPHKVAQFANRRGRWRSQYAKISVTSEHAATTRPREPAATT
ncbi:UNVERIFIED_CONTAM: hypothetical protein Sradi_1525600 [Sesamum radiatum]|uniref:Uncharacterized protein n=1 Tax=Sesamum radiatum TaxID=300843 RepID=A0AAW2U8M6_SESRA